MKGKQITYINKDFTDFKNALVEYAKAYFPTTYNDFSESSPGSMFIDMAAYVGDVLSFYLDNQIQETFLPYSKQKSNIYALAYMLGYKPKVTAASTVDLDIYQTVPSKVVNGEYVPDFDYSLIIEGGMRVKSNSTNTPFYISDRINFSISSSSDPTDVSILSFDGGGNPLYYVLKKSVRAISGEIKESNITFTDTKKFASANIVDDNIIQIIDVVDSDGNIWYEVPYLAQDTIMEGTPTTSGDVPESFSNQVPYILQLRKVPRRFVSRFTSENTLQLQFGAGVNSVADEAIIYNPYKSVGGSLDALTKMKVAYDPANITTTYTYGLAPRNTTLTVKYLVGGGAQANVPSNNINGIMSYSHKFYGGNLDSGISTSVLNSLAVNNPNPAIGGGDGDDIEEIRQNTLLQFPSQLRAVTREDYLSFTYNMPSQFGDIAKAYINKDSHTFDRAIQGNQSLYDPATITLYVLSFDNNKKLVQASNLLKNNLKTYLNQYRMLTDTVYVKDAFVINIAVEVDVIPRPNYSKMEVISRTVLKLQEIFNIDRWNINQPIILSNIYSELDLVEGIQTVKDIKIINKFGESEGYSRYSYDINSAKINGVIYPSLDPSIFEVKNLNTDLKVRIVTL